MNGNECCPFILRFSKSMLRPNPRKVMAGKTRINPKGTPDTEKITENLKSGFSFYRGFGFNSGLPVFSRMSLRLGSASKSLRYHFLNVTGIKPAASLSLYDFVFSIGTAEELAKVNRVITRSKNREFLASMSHISEIDAFLPCDKAGLSGMFIEQLKDSPQGTPFYLNTFHGDKEQVVSFLKNEAGASETKEINLGGFSMFRTVIPDIKSKLDTLFAHSLIKSISPESILTLTPNYVRHEDLPLDCVLPRDLTEQYPKAAIIDSGVAENSYLKEWELEHVNMTESIDGNHRHGTFVAGRLLTDGETFGGITYLNVEMLPPEGFLRLDIFHEKMRSLLKKYSKTIRIYNLSLGSGLLVSGEEYSAAAHMLDSMQKEFDVLFIISGGNFDKLRTEHTLPDENMITSPAESIHSLTVGSAAHTDTNLQLKDSPSLFTRKGPSVAGTIKPDICAYGGAHEIRMGRIRPVGVFSIGIRNELAEDSGTSHAVPRASALAAKIYHRYSHAFRSPDMTKAIILHYTHLRHRKKPDVYSGYGVLAENTPDFENLPESAVYLHSGKVYSGGIAEVTDIPVPEILFENGAAFGSLCLTLVYKTETDMNFPHFYTCTNLDVSVGYYKKDVWTAILTSKNLLTCTDSEDRQDIREKLKWHPVKMYEKELKNSRLPSALCMRLTPSKRDFYEKKFHIEYSIVLSFTHETKNLFEFLQGNLISYDGVLEPASDMWKRC